MTQFLSLANSGIFIFSCPLLALLVASFSWELILYATGKGDDAERAGAKKHVLRYTGYLTLFMLAWWLIPLALRIGYATLLSWTVNR